jgi:hypothetical protein
MQAPEFVHKIRAAQWQIVTAEQQCEEMSLVRSAMESFFQQIESGIYAVSNWDARVWTWKLGELGYL